MSIHEVFRAFSHRSWHDAERSTLGVADRLRADLVPPRSGAASSNRLERLLVSPSPVRLGRPLTRDDFLVRHLRGEVEFDDASTWRLGEAGSAAHAWYSEHRSELRLRFTERVLGSGELDRWIDWHAKNVRAEHVGLRASLVDESLRGEVGDLTTMSPDEVASVGAIGTTRLGQLAGMDTDEARAAKVVYVASSAHARHRA